MALQRVRTVEALNTKRQTQNCNSKLLKILMILNLVIVVSLLLRKVQKECVLLGTTIFQHGKDKIILADTKSYVSLDLNKIAGNTHVFKFIGELSLENITLRKNWIWDVLEIRWMTSASF